MKRLFLILCAAVLLTVAFSGCSVNERGQDGKINVVCTIFPQYDWVREIIGEENMDNFNLSLLIDSRVDLHSYNPSVQDIANIKKSDVFIYIGGDSDNWVEAVLRDANPDIITLNLVDLLGDIIIIDEHEHDEENCEEDHDHSEHEHHADEHVWLSLRNAKIICNAIADMLTEIDPDNAQAYKENLEVYTAKLSALDADFMSVVNNANINTLVFADRFPFRYLMSDYGLNHYAAFSGCSAETEASFVTIISLANRLNQLNLGVVCVTESSDRSIARTVINNTNAKNQNILVFDSMQSVTSADIRNGVTYLSIMENNLNILKEALK